jgi:hypothetical protein
MTTTKKGVRPQIQAVIDECLPKLRALGSGRCAVTIGGSHGKGTFDERSDLDFRVFCDEIVGAPRYRETEVWRAFARIVDHQRAQGINIDNCWVRTTGEIESELAAWLNGRALPVEMVWTLWGYHLLTDIANQMVIDDPSGIVAGWQARLTPYPRALQRAVMEKHMGSLNYWRSDFHYRNKVERRDQVFLAGISSRLVHDMTQVLFAINNTYYVGDGNNLHYVEQFAVQPKDFASRVRTILYPPQSGDALTAQYEMTMELIDELAPLAAEAKETGTVASKSGAGDVGQRA